MNVFRTYGWVLLAVSGCDVTLPVDTGGTDVAAGPCGRGLVVVETDYLSTNVGLIGLDGRILSERFQSSASAGTLSLLSLSGDVVVPTMPQNTDEVALIDRSAGMLTWVGVQRGTVSARLSVNQQFNANPQDYLRVATDKAYVTRYAPNLNAGKQPFDGGSDVVVIDPNPTKPTLTGRIDLVPALDGEPPGFYPRPNRLVLDHERVIVLLSAYAIDFKSSVSSRLVVVDAMTDTIRAVKVLDGMHGCQGLALAPGGGRVAVTCSGTFQNTTTSTMSQAGVVVLEQQGDALVEQMRVPAAALGERVPAFSVTFAAPDLLLFTTFPQGGQGDDAAMVLHLSTGVHETLLRAEAFTLGEVCCASACQGCFVAVAGPGRGALHRCEVQGTGLVVEQTLVADPSIGLPPRYLGLF